MNAFTNEQVTNAETQQQKEKTSQGYLRAKNVVFEMPYLLSPSCCAKHWEFANQGTRVPCAKGITFRTEPHQVNRYPTHACLNRCQLGDKDRGPHSRRSRPKMLLIVKARYSPSSNDSEPTRSDSGHTARTAVSNACSRKTP
jgi:hypothetical protein